MPSLFARLRPAPPPSSAAYDAAVNIARQSRWYRQGAVPDTMDGRFAVLATVLALVTLRLEEGGDATNPAAVAMTEAFIADMDAQMRQAGFGDPSLGKQVRSLVGSLASRVDRWRRVEDVGLVVRRSVYRDAEVAPEALDHAIAACTALRDRLTAASIDDIRNGQFT